MPLQNPLASIRNCLVLVIAVGAPAQTVHVVGPGGLPQITSAIAIAAPGDVIHVLPGTYLPFTVSIRCTIRGMGAPGTVTVIGAGTTISPPVGETLHVHGLRFQDQIVGGIGVLVNRGRVTFDTCTFTSSGTPLTIYNADAHLQDCDAVAMALIGQQPGMNVSSANVTAIDSSFHGSPPTPFVYFASAGVNAQLATLHFSHCEVVAGAVGPSTLQLPCYGLANNGGQVWLSDSTVIGRSCPFADTASVAADRCTLTPACPPPPTGNLLGVTRTAPLQNGANFTLTYQTIPNSYAAIFASQQLGTLMIPGLHAQMQWLDPAGVFNLGVVLADGLGRASATWAIPAGAWLVDQPLWFQGLTGFSFPLQLSPVAGGVIR